MTIRLARLSSGRYVGLTFSDRWNLMSLMETEGLDVNACGLEVFRRRIRRFGFKIRTERGSKTPVYFKTAAEVDAFRPCGSLLGGVLKRFMSVCV